MYSSTHGFGIVNKSVVILEWGAILYLTESIANIITKYNSAILFTVALHSFTHIPLDYSLYTRLWCICIICIKIWSKGNVFCMFCTITVSLYHLPIQAWNKWSCHRSFCHECIYPANLAFSRFLSLSLSFSFSLSLSCSFSHTLSVILATNFGLWKSICQQFHW